MSETERPEMARTPWGDAPYDDRTPAEVVHDYAMVRGDLSEQYARDQLATWIERAITHAKAEGLREYAAELDWVRPEKCPCDNPEACCGSEASCDAMQRSTRIVGALSLRARADLIEPLTRPAHPTPARAELTGTQAGEVRGE